MLDLVDPIEDSIRTSTGSEDAGEVAAQRSTDSPGIVDEGAREELDTAAATASGRFDRMARLAGGVRTSS